MLLSFGSYYSQQGGFNDLDKIFDEHEKEYQQKNNPYAESPNDTERIRQMKKVLNAQRQREIEINNLAKKQEEESNQYQNIENNALSRAANSISPTPQAPSDLMEATETAGKTPEQKAYNNAKQTVGISNANDGIIIANNKEILTTKTETKEVNKEMILAFSFVVLLFLLIMIRRKKNKN